jgi:hypothetical protein
MKKKGVKIRAKIPTVKEKHNFWFPQKLQVSPKLPIFLDKIYRKLVVRC